MKTSVENYNELVPFMNELIKRGYRLDARHNKTQGFGFLVEAADDLYVDVCIWGDEMLVELNRRNSKYHRDVLNDITIRQEKHILDTNHVKELVNEYLNYAKTLEKVYRVELTETELNTIINLVDEKLKEKLKSYLQTK